MPSPGEAEHAFSPSHRPLSSQRLFLFTEAHSVARGGIGFNGMMLLFTLKHSIRLIGAGLGFETLC